MNTYAMMRHTLDANTKDEANLFMKQTFNAKLDIKQPLMTTGKKYKFNYNVVITMLSETSTLFARIRKLIAAVPAGKVATYGQIALLAGRPSAARAVSWAMRTAPIYPELPCHRIVNKTGVLAPDHVFGGREKQRQLLLREGVPFLPDGRIDLRACLWDGPADQ